jgi:hypothetical protein
MAFISRPLVRGGYTGVLFAFWGREPDVQGHACPQVRAFLSVQQQPLGLCFVFDFLSGFSGRSPFFWFNVQSRFL